MPQIHSIFIMGSIFMSYVYLSTKILGAQIKLMDTNVEEELSEREVVELPVSRFPEPRCTYQVRLQSERGPLVNRQVSIGELLYHLWDCAYAGNQQQQTNDTSGQLKSTESQDSVYCIMVHSCTISSGSQSKMTPSDGEPVEIVDEFGCSAWPGLLPQIQYKGDLRAVLAVQTFALDFDQPVIFFQCSVRLLLKINGRCRRPQCNAKLEDGQFRRLNSPLNFP